MKPLVLALIAIIAAPWSFGQGAAEAYDDPFSDPEQPAPPPVPATAPAALTVGVRTIMVADLLRVALRSSAAPEAIRAVLARMTPPEIASVVIRLADNPASLRSLLAVMTPAQIAAVSVQLAATDTLVMRVMLAHMTPENIARVIIAARSIDAASCRVILAAVPADKLETLRAILFLADVEGWRDVSPWLDGVGKTGNWLDAGRSRILARISREGYSPGALEEAKALMQKTETQTHLHTK